MIASENPRGSTGETRQRQLLGANAKTDLKTTAESRAFRASCRLLTAGDTEDRETVEQEVGGSSPPNCTNKISILRNPAFWLGSP